MKEFIQKFGMKVALGAVVILLLYFAIQYVSGLLTDLRVANQNLAAATDSLRTTKTAYGEVAQKYAFQMDLSDSLKNVSGLKDQRLISQQRTIASLQVQLSSIKPESVLVQTDSSLSHVFTPTLSDAGVSIQIRDSISFVKPNERWLASQQLSLAIRLWLTNRISRNADGLIVGSVESHSPLISIENVETILDKSLTALPELSFWKLIRIDGTVGLIPNDNSLRGSGTVWYDRWGVGVDVEPHRSTVYKVGYSFSF